MKTPAELQQHAIELGAANKVIIILDPTMSVYACKSSQDPARNVTCISMVPITSKYVYAIAMHELGHVIAPDGCLHAGDANNRLLKLQSEQNAWKWAAANAIMWDADMTKFAEQALRTYTHREPVPQVPGFPPPSRPVDLDILSVLYGDPSAEPPGTMTAPRSLEPPPVVNPAHHTAWRKGLQSFGKSINASRKRRS